MLLGRARLPSRHVFKRSPSQSTQRGLVPGHGRGVALRPCRATPTATSEARLATGKKPADGPSTDLKVIFERLGSLAMPYWTTSEVAGQARWKLAGVVALTLATTGVSVVFNFLGRDFFTALSEKDEAAFKIQLVKYLAGFALGIPVFVIKSYYQSKLALEWRQWMTERLLSDYLEGRTFYQLQQSAEVDNPDQRISSDVATFTDTAMALSLTLLNALIDLVSFSGILYSIYPPLFAALLIYSLGGTAASVALGKNLVTLNFNQEAREADFRYGLVRVRENAESIAFYGGNEDERVLLKERLQAAVENYLGLLTASRNLDFFTSFYRYFIQLLPAAVVAPLFFQGKIDFGVINQSQSAFNHILNDVSLVIYQIEALAGFSAVVDRLGEFTEVMGTKQQQQQQLTEASKQPQQQQAAASTADGGAGSREAAITTAAAAAVEASGAAASGSGSFGGSGSWDAAATEAALSGIQLRYMPDDGQEAAAVEAGALATAAGAAVASTSGNNGKSLLSVDDLHVVTPRGGNLLVQGLGLDVRAGSSLLIMGPSGAGKTSLLRALAGLWSDGRGAITVGAAKEDIMFLPQRPYMVLGSLRDQALYPRRRRGEAAAADGSGDGNSGGMPSDEEVLEVLRLVQLGHLVTRYGGATGSSSGASSNGSSSGNGASSSSSSAALDVVVDWSSSLSLGEQQRLGWARLLLARPRLALLDEATSALDQDTEARLYQVLRESGITFISVGHRTSLKEFHQSMLQLRVDPQGKLTWEVMPLGAAGGQGHGQSNGAAGAGAAVAPAAKAAGGV